MAQRKSKMVCQIYCKEISLALLTLRGQFLEEKHFCHKSGNVLSSRENHSHNLFYFFERRKASIPGTIFSFAMILLTEIDKRTDVEIQDTTIKIRCLHRIKNRLVCQGRLQTSISLKTSFFFVRKG